MLVAFVILCLGLKTRKLTPHPFFPLPRLPLVLVNFIIIAIRSPETRARDLCCHVTWWEFAAFVFFRADQRLTIVFLALQVCGKAWAAWRQRRPSWRL